MLLHNIPKEVVKRRASIEFAYTGTGKPCVCGEILDEDDGSYWDHVDYHISESFNVDLGDIWYCEHSQCPLGSHMYNELDYGSEGHMRLGVEYACQVCIRGECRQYAVA